MIRPAALLPLAFVACTVSLADPAGRACDDTHPCAGGRVCVSGLCTSSATDAGVSDASSPGSTNIHPFGSFDTGCDHWVPLNATDSLSTSLVHSGTGACRFCSTGPKDFSLDDKGPLPAKIGRYHASVWVLIDQGQPNAGHGIFIRTVNNPSGPIDEVEKDGINKASATLGEWEHLEADLVVTKNAEVVNTVIYGQAPTCIVVDDLTLEYTP